MRYFFFNPSHIYIGYDCVYGAPYALYFFLIWFIYIYAICFATYDPVCHSSSLISWLSMYPSKERSQAQISLCTRIHKSSDSTLMFSLFFWKNGNGWKILRILHPHKLVYRNVPCKPTSLIILCTALHASLASSVWDLSQLYRKASTSLSSVGLTIAQIPNLDLQSWWMYHSV